MTIDDLTPEQLRAIQAVTARYRNYLDKLHKRMAALGFRSDDPLVKATAHALYGANDITITAATRATEKEKASGAGNASNVPAEQSHVNRRIDRRIVSSRIRYRHVASHQNAFQPAGISSAN